jgi:hypothetical protein
MAGQQEWQNLGNAFDSFYHQRNAEFLGKCLHQIVFRPRGTIGADRVGRRAVPRDDAEFTRFLDLVEDRLGRGTRPDKACQTDDE